MPGGHVKALTSTSRLIKEYEFSKRSHYIDDQANYGDFLLTKDPGEGHPDKAQYDAEMARLEDKDLDGTVYVKAEWHGFGESMPPARTETLFQKSGAKASKRAPNEK